MKAKKLSKGTFFCDICKSPCMIYKKGKSHRVLVCQNCGVLATNGIFKRKIVKGLGKAALSLVPGGGLISGGLDIAEGLAMSSAKKKDNIMPTRNICTDKRGLYEHKQYMLEKALQ